MRRSGRILGMTMVLGVIVSLLASTGRPGTRLEHPRHGRGRDVRRRAWTPTSPASTRSTCAAAPTTRSWACMYDIASDSTTTPSRPRPRSSQSWEPSEDYMDWTMNIRRGRHVHDGEPLTAEDVAFTFGFIADNEMPFYKDYFPFAPTFEVVSPTQLIWHAQEPTFAPEIPAYAPVLPEHIWERVQRRPRTRRRPRRSSRTRARSAPVRSRSSEYADGEFIHLAAHRRLLGRQPEGHHRRRLPHLRQPGDDGQRR